MARKDTRKAVLITGAAKRIGREMALHLAGRGWDIGLHYHHSKKEAEAPAGKLQAMGANVALLPCDLGQPEQAGTLVQRAIKKLGRLDALIHNASHFKKDTLENFTPDSWAARSA